MKILTEEQMECWNTQGYLLLKEVFSQKDVEYYLKAVDEVVSSQGKKSSNVQQKEEDSQGAYKILRAVEQTSKFDSLIDHPKLFPVILELMGPYLQVMSTELFVRYPDKETLIPFHTDAGPSMQKILPTPTNLPIQFKVQIFLTDVSKPDSGNFSFIPGSHQRYVKECIEGCYIPEVNKTIEQGGFPSDAHQLIANPGDVVIFPWSLWHAVSSNLTNTVRKSICFRYGQLWCRPHDYEKLPEGMIERLTPRQRRLFGDLGEYEGYEPSDYYRPKDQFEVIYGQSD